MEKKKKWSSEPFLPILIILVVGFTAYIPYLKMGFLNEDFLDILWTIPKSFNDIFVSFSSPYGVYWRPISQSLTAGSLYIAGFNPFIFHIENILLHIACAIALYYLILRESKSQVFAFSTSILFLSIVGHLLSVVWLPGKTDILLTLFLLLSFYFYSSEDKALIRWKYFISIIFFILAILSKELAYAGVMLPIILLFRDAKLNIKKVIFSILIASSVVVISLIIRKNLMPGSPFESVNFESFTTNDIIKNFAIYPFLLFFPPEFLETLFFKYQNGSSEPLYFLLVGIVFIVLLIVNFINAVPKRRKYFISGILVYLIMIAPALTELNRWNSFAASTGIMISLSSLVFLKKKWYNIAYNLFFVAIIVFSNIFILSQSENWNNASTKLNQVFKNTDLSEYKNYSALRVWGLPDKYDRINFMKSGNGEIFRHFSKSDSFDTDAPVRLEFYSKSKFKVLKQSQTQIALRYSGARFLPWGESSSSILKAEEFTGNFSGVDYEIISKWENGNFLSDLYIKRKQISKDTLDIYFTGERFIKF